MTEDEAGVGSTVNDADADSRKKAKQTHHKVFQIDLPGVTNIRADSPKLLQEVVDLTDGSGGNSSQSEGDHASMHD